jgi:hypothetical protein
MLQQAPVVYPVPTHLEQREPFAFGRTVGEVARLVVVGCVAARVVDSDSLPSGLRVPAAALVLLVGSAWVLVRIQRRPLDGWLALLFRYGAMPRRRVWRPGGSCLASEVAPTHVERERGRYQLARVRVRWAEPPGPAHHPQPAPPPRTGGMP